MQASNGRSALFSTENEKGWVGIIRRESRTSGWDDFAHTNVKRADPRQIG